MMKNLYLTLLAACLLPMSLGAQPFQKIMGHYESDSISATGYSFNTTGSHSLGVILEPDELEMYLGGKIVAFRVGLVQPSQITKVFVIPISSSGKYGKKVEWPCDMGDAGWNVITLDTPYDINLGEGEKLMIGYYFKQELDVNSISLVQVGNPYDSYTYKLSGSSGKWRSVDFINYGNLSVQCVVEKDYYPDYEISTSDFQSDYYVMLGDQLQFVMNIHNKGIKPIDVGGFAVNVMIDGKLEATVTNQEPFVSGYCTFAAGVPTDGLTLGQHTLAVQAVSVNGEVIEDADTLQTDFVVYRQGFPRQKHLIEQFTSTYCTWCPLGNETLKYFTRQRDDIIWVGVHGNLGSGVDPFRTYDSEVVMASLGANSYPSASFDRTTGWTDNTSIVYGISYGPEDRPLVAKYLGYFFDDIAKYMPTLAEIDGDCSFNEETRMATVTIKGRVSPDFDEMLGADSRLTVYLVEDSLVADQLDGGTWISGYVHNGVFRKALPSYAGEPLNRVNNRYKNTYRYQIPDRWNWHNMRVVAFISRPVTNNVNGYTDLFINNVEAFSFRVSDAVEEISSDVNAVPVEYYDIMGHRYDSPQQGINIVRMSDGTSRKVLVR